MQKIKILVPIDGSKNSIRGLSEAIFLARRCGATITGLHVIPFYLPMTGPEFLGPYKKAIQKQAAKLMDKAKLLSVKHGIVFKPKISEGDVIANDILNFAAKGRFDLIIIASRGLGPIKGWFLGSVANHLVHRSKIPILVVK